jgi:hypothetical protein
MVLFLGPTHMHSRLILCSERTARGSAALSNRRAAPWMPDLPPCRGEPHAALVFKPSYDKPFLGLVLFFSRANRAVLLRHCHPTELAVGHRLVRLPPLLHRPMSHRRKRNAGPRAWPSRSTGVLLTGDPTTTPLTAVPRSHQIVPLCLACLAQTTYWPSRCWPAAPPWQL